jgi:AraC-like DNA-binding protein
MGNSVVRNSTLQSHYESVERVILAMRSQIDQPLTLRQMAKIGCVSPYHFNRTFRQVTGVPPSQFLYALRLDAAKQLLAQTQKKVIDICYEVGYNSLGTFTRRFADVLGVPPSRFRKLVHSRSQPTPAPELAGMVDQETAAGACVSGFMTVPSGFRGLIAVGLFTTPIPQGTPVACTLVSHGGPYAIHGVPEGEFYLFALGLANLAEGVTTVDHGNSLRAGGRSVHVSGGTVEGATALDLRPPSPFDAPILLAIPSLAIPSIVEPDEESKVLA